MTTNRLACTLGLLVTLIANEATAAGGVKLAYRGSPEPAAYWIHTRDSTKRFGGPAGGPGANPAHVYETIEQVQQTLSPAADGLLDVRIERVAIDLRVDGVPVAVEGRGPITYRMGPRGARVPAVPDADLSEALAPVFPDEPVQPGHTWSVTAAPTTSYPVAVTVTHRFETIETVEEQPCALITSTATAKGQDAELEHQLSLSGKTWLAVSSGKLVKGTSVTDFEVRAPAGFPEGHTTIRRSITRVIDRGDGPH